MPVTETNQDKVTGGCFCGAIKFEFNHGDYLVANCHCHMCRKTSGAAFMTWVMVPKSTFNYLQGTPKKLASSSKAIREFCADCGTPMVFYTTDRPDELDITTGSLSSPEHFIPNRSVHSESKLPWLHQTEID